MLELKRYDFAIFISKLQNISTFTKRRKFSANARRRINSNAIAHDGSQ